ncbi:MAG TPA: hypothetical protein VIM87_07820 [Chitinophaga sp.]|uniref:hypothetical protein n=1 Tax=Chitinophaga sp. TaxID=1869181 RepID=UPI002F9375C3
MQNITITQTDQLLEIKEGCIEEVKFLNARVNKLLFNDVGLPGAKITNANLSDLEIEGAQLGGAYIHNIGLPPKGHPFYDPAAKQRPLTFEDCYLAGSGIINCNLQDVQVRGCDTQGMTINGIPVQELLAAYEKQKA